MRAGFRCREVEEFDQIVVFVFASRDEGEGDDLTFREQNQRRVMHDELVTICVGTERLDEIGSDELMAVDLGDGGVAVYLESFRCS
jgi:hypothetical protein